MQRSAGLCVHWSVLLALWLQACSAPRVAAESTGVVGSETFSIVFLQQRLDFALMPDFSSHSVAESFCARHGFPAQHVRAVRELVENAVADALGSDRVEAGMRDEVSCCLLPDGLPVSSPSCLFHVITVKLGVREIVHAKPRVLPSFGTKSVIKPEASCLVWQ